MAQVRTRARRPRTLGMLGLAAVAVLGIAGCAAGQDAQTAQETPAIDGTATKIGVMYVQAAAVVAPDKSWPQGGDAPLQLVLINSGLQTDQLTRITTDAASSVAFFASGAASSGATGSGSATRSASSSTSSGSASSTSGAGSSGTKIDSISITTGQRLPIGMSAGDQAIVLQGLTKELFPAASLVITLTFQHAGTGSLAIPVHLGAPPSNRPTLNVSPTEAPQ